MHENGGTAFFSIRTLKDGRTLFLRAMEPDDAMTALALGREIGAETDFLRIDENGFGVDVAREREWIENANRRERGALLIGFVEDDPACIFGLEIDENPRLNHSAEIGLCVRKKYWGLGIGAAILDTLICIARGRGDLKKLDLSLRSDNLRAKALYERSGFQSAGVIPARFLIRGQYYDELRMYLFL